MAQNSELLEKKLNTIFQNTIGISEIDNYNSDNGKLLLAKEDIDVSFNSIYPNIKDDNIYTQEIPLNPQFTKKDENGNLIVDISLDYFTLNDNLETTPRNPTDNIKLQKNNFFFWDFNKNTEINLNSPITTEMINYDQTTNKYIEMKFRAITDTTKIVRKYNRIILQQDKTNDNTFVLYDNSGHNLLKDIIIPNHSQINTVQPYNIKLEWTTIDNLYKTNQNDPNVNNPEEIPYGVMGGNWFLNKNDGKIIFEDNPHDINDQFFSYKK